MTDVSTQPNPVAGSATPKSTTSWREAGWLRKGGAAPPRRRRRPLVRMLIALTSSTALFGVAALVAVFAIVPPVGARRAARVSAQREVKAQRCSRTACTIRNGTESSM